LINSVNIERPKVAIRVDGNSRIGLGHFTRCIALGQMIKQDFKILFYMHQPSDEVIDEVKRNDFDIETIESSDVKEFSKQISEISIVIIDGYQFTEEDQLQLKEKTKLVFIDDLINQHYFADVIINHGLTVSKEDYRKENYTKVCAGVDYLLLRESFLKDNYNISLSQGNQVFVCMGGADINQLSIKIVRYLDRFNGILNILLGNAYIGNVDVFKKYKNVKVYKNLSEKEVAKLIDDCHICIVSASGIAYECASRRKRILIGHYLDHQIGFYESILSKSQFYGLGDINSLSKDRLLDALELVKNKELVEDYFVDGLQGERFIQVFKELLV
jgi:UDP-2,4-diacetamido-2,4,6-trideoxy-beta-L-altropyranose hydrolase